VSCPVPYTGLVARFSSFTNLFSVVICIIFGCSVPVVLRKTSETLGPDKRYICRFIGECYVHGMMDGGAINVQESKELKTLTFELQ
jgi:hypothetical protein